MLHRKLRIAFFLLLVALLPFGRAASADDFEFFENKIRPLLVERCYKCHSTESEKLKGGLLLDTRDGLLKGGEGGPVLVPGNPDKSRLIEAVRYLNPDLAMPPKEKLNDTQIADLIAWVKLGAPDPRTNNVKTASAVAVATAKDKPPYDYEAWRKWWSFQPPKDSPVPKVKNKQWPKSSIDAFILAKLEEKKLKPAPAADKRALLRRSTFDLTGLAPTPEEIDAFLADHSKNAFAKVVDRLLASPAYGERWGRHWLDVVRYADSKDVRDIGQSYDIVESYRYRDWVIAAFNRDLPYNQFVIDQIAGDLIHPPETNRVNADGIIATGLLTIGCWGPGDADLQKMYTDMVDDQINVLSRSFLGLTMGCARCHDHKFDPFPTADYYALAGIFFSTQIAIPQISAPYNKVPLVAQAEVDKFNDYMARITALEKQIKQFTDDQYALLIKNSVAQTARYLTATWDYENRPAEKSRLTPREFADELKLRGDAFEQWLDYLGLRSADSRLLTKSVRDLSGHKGVHALKNDAAEPIVIVNSTDHTETIPGTLPAHSVAIHPGPTTGVGVGWKSPLNGTVRITGRVADGHAACGDGIDWVLEQRRSKAIIPLLSGTIPNGGESQSFDKTSNAARLESVSVQAGDIIRLVVLPRKEHGCDLTSVELELSELGGQQRKWNLAHDIATDLLAEGKGNPHSDGYGNSDTWNFYETDAGVAVRRADRSSRSALMNWFQTVSEASPTQRNNLERVANEIQQTLDAVAREPVPPPSTNSEPPTATARLYQDLGSEQGPFRISKRDHETFLTANALANLKKMSDELETLKKDAPPPFPVAMGAKEGGVAGTKYAGFHDAAIHIRGRYDRLGEVVPRRFPQILAGDNQPPITQGSGRMELAKWIAHAENPLTARVMVNRIWQNHFGEGIVRTPGNFGKMGERPTHPELLDFLANRFVESGWSMKAMHHLIMLSAVYQQSSRTSAETLQADVDNRLFSRMNIRRLEAEAIRDHLLTVCGKLDRTVGGPPLRKQGEDAASPRRAVYLMTNRSDKTGFRFLFDAADPENIVDQRTISIVAPQALFLLNNSFALAQVPAFAERIMADKSGTDASRLERAYVLLYSRPPTKQETTVGLEFLARASQKNAAEKDAARLAWEEYCQVLLCANELIYVD